jgi:hypothetical protein
MIHPRTIQSGDHTVNLIKAQLEQATKQTYNSISTKFAYRRCSRVDQRLRHGEYAEPETRWVGRESAHVGNRNIVEQI